MDARKPSPSAGERLKELRVGLGLATRDVEEKSQQIAEDRHNREYYISHAWVTDIENGKFTPSIYKFHTFSAIYNRKITELLSYFGLPVGDLSRYRTFIGVPKTHLLDTGSDLEIEKVSLPVRFKSEFSLEKTNLLARVWRSGTRSPLVSCSIWTCANPYMAISASKTTPSSPSSAPVRLWRLTQIKERSALRDGVRSSTVPSTSWNSETVTSAVGVRWTGVS